MIPNTIVNVKIALILNPMVCFLRNLFAVKVKAINGTTPSHYPIRVNSGNCDKHVMKFRKRLRRIRIFDKKMVNDDERHGAPQKTHDKGGNSVF